MSVLIRLETILAVVLRVLKEMEDKEEKVALGTPSLSLSSSLVSVYYSQRGLFFSF